MIETGFYQALTNNGTISSLVNTNVFRVFRKAMPLPAVVFQLVSRGSIDSFDGRNALEVGRYQFDSYAANADTVVQLADAIKNIFVPLSTQANFPASLTLAFVAKA